jgi:transcription elongation factor Elf1
VLIRDRERIGRRAGNRWEDIMLVQLSCPWCDQALAVDAERLDEVVRCDGCAVRFEFADPQGSTRTEMAEAA